MLMEGLYHRPGEPDTLVPMRLSEDGMLLPREGGSGTGSSDTTEATQLAVKVAVESINTKTPSQVSSCMPVTNTQRNCTGQQLLNVSNTPALLFVSANSVACKIQADGGVLRISHNGTNPSDTFGIKVNGGEIYYADTNLSTLKLYSSAGCAAQVVYFDKV